MYSECSVPKHRIADVGHIPLHVWIHRHACCLHPLHANGSIHRRARFSEADNGRIFALIGILGIVTQGGLLDL